MNPLLSAISRYIPRQSRNRGRTRKNPRKTQRQRVCLEVLEDRTLLSTYLVNTTADSGAGSLRQAILNADAQGGANTINIAIGSGVQTIQVGSSTGQALPTITCSVTIDGTSQLGYNGSPLIELNGSSAGSGANGLSITGGNSTVHGLVIDQFGQNGIYLSGGGGDLIVGNYIGTDVSGTVSKGNGNDGIRIESSGNTVGGVTTTPETGAGNVISGNKGNASGNLNAAGGISISTANNNVVEGNLIGTNAAGTGALGNSGFGVIVLGTSTGNNIGGTGTTARNVVSANGRSGIGIALGATGNSVMGNYIGTDITGKYAIGNASNGVLVTQNSNGNTIDNNVVSGNGVSVAAAGVNIINSNNNVVQGNFIGTDSTGTTSTGTDNNSLGNVPIGGFGAGVAIQSNPGVTATGNKIGGTTTAAQNIIAGNREAGVWFNGAGVQNNLLQGNIISGNTGNGVQLTPVTGNSGGGSNNTITGNVISGNSLNGIMLTDTSTTGNRLTGNSIYNNSGPGINLGGGATPLPNDTQGHTGPNNFQDFPMLSSAASSSTDTSITGIFTEGAEPNTTITLEFYATPAADHSGYGQGETYLGSRTISTNASGSATFNADFAISTAGQYISATATDQQGNTSEFSADKLASSSSQTFAQNLSAALPQSNTGTNTMVIQANTNTINDVVFGLSTTNLGSSVNEPVSVYLNLAPGSYQTQTVQVPTGMTLYINGVPGTTIDPASPAFTVTSGNVVVSNVTFVTTGDAPTILVTGGSLTLRNDVVQGSTGYTDAAISITGGTLDLGNASDPGGNTLNVDSTGQFVQNTTGNSLPAVGNTFEINGAVQSATTLSFTSLSTSAATSSVGQSVTLTATAVANGGGNPTGEVDFVDATTNTDLGSVALSGDTALLTTAIPSVGNHVIEAIYSGDGTFLGGNGSVTQTVNPATPTVIVTDAGGTYNGQSFAATATATGAISGTDNTPSASLEGVSPILTYYSGTYTQLSALPSSGGFSTAPTNAGDYTVVANFTGSADYTSATALANFTINKANATITVTPYSLTYDGNAHTATGTVKGVGGVNLSGLDLSGTTHTNAGTYTDNWTFTDTTGNYNNATETVSDCIAKANATINVTGYNVTYDSNSHTATGTATGVKGEVLSGLALSGTTHTNACTTTDTWTFTDVTGNYNNASSTVSDSIAKATPAVSVTDAGGTYNGSAFPATATVTGVSGTPGSSLENVTPTLTYYQGTYTLANLPSSGGSSTAPSAVGAYTVVASFAGSADYTTSSALTNFSITDKFGAYLPPVSLNMNLVEGRTVPIKFQLTDASGNAITSTGGITLMIIGPNGYSLSITSANGLTYGGGQFQYNWQTPRAPGNYTVSIYNNSVLVPGSAKTLTIVAPGGSAAGLETGSAGGTSLAGALLGGEVDLYVDNSNGDLNSDELARVQDAVNSVEATVAPYGVVINEVTDPTQANVTLTMNSTSSLGGVAQGVLGCTDDADQVTMIQGWNWYAASDPTQVGAGQYDFETAVMHELGHVLGLGHSSSSTSVMYASLATGTANRVLTTADLSVPDSDSGPCALHAAPLAPVSNTSNGPSIPAPSSTSAPSSGGPMSAADQLFANFTLVLNEIRNGNQPAWSSVAALWQSIDALALQRLDLLLSMEAGAIGMSKDTLMRELLFAS
jgi:parallel beta-helix repeat protein